MSPMRPATPHVREVARALAELGAEGASMDELARRAEVAKPTLYAHYGSREALVAACIDTEAERLLDQLERQPPAGALGAYAASSPAWPLLLRSEHPAARGARRRIADRVARGLTGTSALAPALLAAAFLAAAAALLELCGEPDEALPELAERLLRDEAR
jgi:AcrR family transcriptional regulator